MDDTEELDDVDPHAKMAHIVNQDVDVGAAPLKDEDERDVLSADALTEVDEDDLHVGINTVGKVLMVDLGLNLLMQD